MKKLTLAVALAAGTIPAAAQETYSIDPRHTFPTYEVLHLGIATQRGMFTKVSGKITIDRAAKTGNADITLDMTGVTTAEPKLADHLRAADFFDVQNHPTATFKAGNFRFEGDKLVAISGDLTLRGTTRPVTLAVNAFNCREHPVNKKAMCGADATATIKRSEFGIKYGLAGIADDVKISIPVEAYKD